MAARTWRRSQPAGHGAPRRHPQVCFSYHPQGAAPRHGRRYPPGSLRPRHDVPEQARGYGEGVSAEPGRPPLSMRFKEHAWTRVDWALAAICAFLVYGTMVKGQGIHDFPVSLVPTGSWAPPLLALLVAVPVGLRRRAPVGACLLALVGCVLIITAGGQISRG